MAERLTAEQLKITDAEMEDLLWVRDALDPTISDVELPGWMKFDMEHWSSPLDVNGNAVHEDTSKGGESICGTMCCIGGSMEARRAGIVKQGLGMGLNVFQKLRNSGTYRDQSEGADCYFGRSRSLCALFYHYAGERAQSRQAAVEAINRFLEGNIDDPWLVGRRYHSVG